MCRFESDIYAVCFRLNASTNTLSSTLSVYMKGNHGSLYYKPGQRKCDFCIWGAFDVLNILNIVIYLVNAIICDEVTKITQIIVEI